MKNVLVIILLAAAALYFFWWDKKDQQFVSKPPESKPEKELGTITEAALLPFQPGTITTPLVGIGNSLASVFPQIVVQPPKINLQGVTVGLMPSVSGYDGSQPVNTVKLPWWLRADKSCNSGICLYNPYYPGCTHCLYKNKNINAVNNA